jgi:hypothetical protein
MMICERIWDGKPRKFNRRWIILFTAQERKQHFQRDGEIGGFRPKYGFCTLSSNAGTESTTNPKILSRNRNPS